MAWRVVKHADRTWNVSVAAERRANSNAWALVLSFRPEGPGERSVWAEAPLQSSSRSAIFVQAERLSDAKLTEMLAQQLAAAAAAAG